MIAVKHAILFAAFTASCLGILADEPSFEDFDTPLDIENAPETRSERLALSARLGYGFRLGGGQYPGARKPESQEFGSDAVLVGVEDHYLNYGQGLKIELAGSFALMDNLAAELALCFTGRVPRTVITFDDASVPVSWEEKFKQASFGAKLMVIPEFRVLELVDVHVGWGLGLFFTRLRFENSDQGYKDGEGYAKTRPGLAFCGRIGAVYPVTDIIAITVDLSTDAVSFTLKQWRPSGTTLATVPVYTSERNRSTASADVRRPAKIPGSNAALRAGVRLSLL